MQEETLRLILLALSEGAHIARKTLVMYIVQMLSDDYPQASKTCVGHVVQLLYRASCFNVGRTQYIYPVVFKDAAGLHQNVYTSAVP